MELAPEQRILILERRVDEIAEDLQEVEKFVRGNGDPTKGLLWLVTDQARLVAAQAQLVDTHIQSFGQFQRESTSRFERHIESDHYSRVNPWRRLGYRVAEQVVAFLAIGLIALAVLGAVSYLNGIRL